MGYVLLVTMVLGGLQWTFLAEMALHAREQLIRKRNPKCTHAHAGAHKHSHTAPQITNLFGGPPVVEQAQRLVKEDAHVDGFSVSDAPQQRDNVRHELRTHVHG